MQVTSTLDTLTKDEWHESIALWLRDCGIKKNYPTGCGIKKSMLSRGIRGINLSRYAPRLCVPRAGTKRKQRRVELSTKIFDLETSSAVPVHFSDDFMIVFCLGFQVMACPSAPHHLRGEMQEILLRADVIDQNNQTGDSAGSNCNKTHTRRIIRQLQSEQKKIKPLCATRNSKRRGTFGENESDYRGFPKKDIMVLANTKQQNSKASPVCEVISWFFNGFNQRCSCWSLPFQWHFENYDLSDYFLYHKYFLILLHFSLVAFITLQFIFNSFSIGT